MKTPEQLEAEVRAANKKEEAALDAALENARKNPIQLLKDIASGKFDYLLNES